MFVVLYYLTEGADLSEIFFVWLVFFKVVVLAGATSHTLVRS